MKATRQIIGLAGWSGSGKTTLLKALIPTLTSRGLSVSTVKHAHHRFDIDRPGKDSFEHRAAGAREVLVASAQRWALMHELRDASEPALEELLAKLSPVDLVIVEGFKADAHEKIEIRRAGLAKPPLVDQLSNIVAVATDDPGVDPAPLPRLDLNDASAIADFILVKRA